MTGFRHLGDRLVHQGHIWHVAVAQFEAPGGERFERDIVRSPGAVAAVPLRIDEQGDVTVVLVRQYRPPFDDFVLEVPAGMRDVPGEPTEVTAARELVEEALALEAAGCFSLVLEAVPAPVAARIREELEIPTIGIGSGADCDGQVLVLHDLLGLYDGRSPRFAKRYAELGAEIQGALERFAAEVRAGSFPAEEHTYAMPEEELAAFLAEP